MDINKWIDGKGLPLCNTFVNIVRQDWDSSERRDALLQFVDLPYRPYLIAENRRKDADPRRFGITELILDDLMIDIVYNRKDGISLHIECENNILDPQKAESIAKRWSRHVEELLKEE